MLRASSFIPDAVDTSLTLTGFLSFAPNVSSAGTLTLGNGVFYIFTGTTTTWTLPAVSSTSGRIYFIKNRGSGAITLQRAGSDNIYDTSVVTSILVNPGTSVIMGNDGTYYVVM